MQQSNQLKNIITIFKQQNKLKIFSTVFQRWLAWNCITVILLVLTEYFYHFNTFIRCGITGSYIVYSLIGTLLFFKKYSALSAKYRGSDRDICKLIERNLPDKTVIWQLFDLYQLANEESQQDNSLVNAAISDYTNRFKAENPAPVIDRSFKRTILFSTAGLLSVIILISIPPFMRQAATRLILCTREFKTPLSHELKIETEKLSILAGDSLRINCLISGKQPETIYFYKKIPGEAKWSQLLLTPGNNQVSFFIPSVDQGFSCYFASAETSSDTATIEVKNYPRLAKMQITITPPAYTRLSQEKIEKISGELTTYAGTNIDFQLTTDSEADSAILHWESAGTTTTQHLSKSSNEYNLSKSARAPAIFSFLFYTQNRCAAKPVRYRLNILPDEPPVVKINFPESEFQPGDDNILPLLASAGDDFAVTKAIAVCKKNSAETILGDLKIAAKENIYTFALPLEKQADGVYIIQTELPLDKLQLLNGESAELYVQVFDNDQVSGSKSAKSQTILIKMPTLEELFKTTDESYKEQKKETAKQLDKSKDLREKIKKLSDDLKSGNQQNWDDKAKLEQAVSGQQEMLKDLAKMEDNIKANMENLEKNSLLSKETMDKYRRLQKMVDNLFSEEMKNKLEKLSEMAGKDKVSKDELNKILDGLDEQQKKFQEGLEKTMQILEQIQTEYQLDKLLKTFNDLIEKQENINQSLQKDDSAPKVLQNREQEIEQRYNVAIKDLQEMGNSDNKLLKNIQQKIKSTTSEFKEQNVQADMQKQQQETSAQQNQQANKTGSKVASKLSAQAGKLQDLKDTFNKQQKEELDEKIALEAQKILTLSQMTEDLKNTARNLTSKSSLGKEVLIRFADLKNSISQTAENIFIIARQTFFIDAKTGAAISRINQKLPIIKTILESRNFMQSASEQVYLMADLNELFLLLNEARENLKNAESASGLSEMLKKMEELAKKQAELNEKSGNMQGQSGEGGMPMPGMGGSPGGAGKGSEGSGESMSDMMSRLAKEQAAIQDALNQLMGENGMQPGGKGQGNKPGSGEGGNQPGGKGKGNKGGQGSEGEDGEGEGNRDNAGKLGKKLGGMSQSAQEIINEMQNKKMTESILKKQDTLLKHMLETVNSLRQERFDNKRESEGGKKSAINPGKVKLEEAGQTLREKMIRSLKEGYTREYQQKIREYFKELEK